MWPEIFLAIWAAGFISATLPEVPGWIPWLSPAVLGVLVAMAYRKEAAAPSSGGDSQPGLVRFVGVVVVGVAVALVVAGLLVRHRRTKRTAEAPR